MNKFRRLVSLILVVMMVFSIAGPGFAAEQVSSTTTEDGRVQVTFEFNDSKEAEWALEYIAKMQSMDVFKGYEDGTFRPNQPVKRVEAIVTAVRLMGLEDEAKAKSKDTKLHFKDARLIDQKFAWAKGYIIVALENGLFDTSEANIQPDTPASRVWIASLLVRALGLESEALKLMTTVPDFKDSASIPAGAIGYVNVAVDRGLVTGYPDNTFKPVKNVTRAEMAAFLERTNEGLLEENGAVTVMGKITSLSFNGSVTQDVYNDGSVTESVYQLPNGSITVQSFNGDAFTYGISSNLLVKYGKRFIPANQLLVDDIVSLVAKDNVVVEAALLDEEKLNESTVGIREFKLEIEMGEDQEYSIKYKNKDGKIEAELKKEMDDSEEKLRGIDAATAVESFLAGLNLTPEMSKDEILTAVLSSLKITEDDFKELELEIKFANGKKVEIEIENENYKEDEEEEDSEENEGYNGVSTLEVKIELSGKKGKYNLKYKHEDGEVKAELENLVAGEKQKLQGDLAAEEIESLLDELALSDDMGKEEIFEAVLSALGIDEDDIKELKIKVEFDSGEEVEIEFENEEDED